MRVRSLLSVLALLVLVAPLGLAQGDVPPEGAESLAASGLQVAYWVGARDAVQSGEAPAPGDMGELWFALQLGDPKNGTGNATANATGYFALVNVTSAALAFETESRNVTLTQADNASAWTLASFPFTIPENATGDAAYSFRVEAYAQTDNGTVLLASPSGGASVTVRTIEAPAPQPGLPVVWLVGGGAAVVVGAGAAVYAIRQRRERELMNRAPRRSSALREEALERAAVKRPAEAAKVQQEIRAQEQVREQRRELQILEAKRADAVKTLELLRKRHEAGGLTKLQYDNMVAKKQADLARIEAEIAEMQRQEGGSAAA